MAAWEALLEPIRIGALTAKNRVEAAPTLTNLANADQSVSRDLVEFYRAQAKGGAGIITVLETAVDSDRAITQPVQLNLGHDRYIPGMTCIVEAIKPYGALASGRAWCCRAWSPAGCARSTGPGLPERSAPTPWCSLSTCGRASR